MRSICISCLWASSNCTLQSSDGAWDIKIQTWWNQVCNSYLWSERSMLLKYMAWRNRCPFPKKGRSVCRWHLRPWFQSYKTPKLFEFIGLDSVAVKWQSPHHSSVLRFNLKSSHEITNSDIIRKKYQSSNTPKFARKLLTLEPLHLILAMKPIQWASMPSVRKPTSEKIKNTPMNCKPNRENIGLWSNSSTNYIWVVSNVLVRIAHAYLPVQWNPTALLLQGSTTGVQSQHIT